MQFPGGFLHLIARATDGNTLLITSVVFVINPHLRHPRGQYQGGVSEGGTPHSL